MFRCSTPRLVKDEIPRLELVHAGYPQGERVELVGLGGVDGGAGRALFLRCWPTTQRAAVGGAHLIALAREEAELVRKVAKGAADLQTGQPGAASNGVLTQRGADKSGSRAGTPA